MRDRQHGPHHRDDLVLGQPDAPRFGARALDDLLLARGVEQRLAAGALLGEHLPHDREPLGEATHELAIEVVETAARVGEGSHGRGRIVAEIWIERKPWAKRGAMFHRSTSTTLFVSTFLALGALAVACGGDSDGSDGTGNAAGSGTAGSGTAGCGTAGSGTVTKECTDYATCAETKCDAEYKQCLGANYKSGDFTGGTCATYQSCIKGCNACDTACTQACKPDAACTSCLSMTVGACVTGKCMTELTACSKSQMGAAGSGSGGSGSGAASCMTLQACCDKIMDASIKMGCTTSASSGSDTACMSALSGYMMFCK